MAAVIAALCMKRYEKMSRYGPAIDHLGNIFETKTAMCQYYGVDRTTYDKRIKNGLNVEQALKACRLPKKGQKSVDHLGNIFETKTDMCNHYHIDHTTFNKRIKNGWSLKDALTTPLRKHVVFDHNGITYDSTASMCEAYHITESLYSFRKDCGYSLEQRLCGKREGCIVDDKGYEYDTIEEMCNDKGVNASTFRTRQRRGASLRECLYGIGVDDEDTDIAILNKIFSMSFSSIRNACHHNNMAAHVYRNRRKKGYTIEESIGIIPLIGPTIRDCIVNEDFQVIENVSAAYFKCILNGRETILHHDDIIDYYRKNVLHTNQKGDTTDVNRT